MKITILALGTRGDVQPYLALGLGLKEAGHQVKLASSDIFEDFARTRGLDFSAVGTSPKEFLSRVKEKTDLDAKQNILSNLPFIKKIIFWKILSSGLEKLMNDSWNCCQDSDVIIFSQLAMPGFHIAEKLGIPCFAAYTNPLTPTRYYPHPLYQSNRLGGIYNWFTYIFEEQVRWQITRKKINQWREQTLQLLPVSGTGIYSLQRKKEIPILHCYSPSVLSKPSDWPEFSHITGYWFLDRPKTWQPPKEIVDFLDAGSPPVYIGFGSMIDRSPKILTKLVLDALVLSQKRGILLGGWGALSNADLPDNVLRVDSIPHDWLFPKMAAVVHHGGAGTTAAGLRAGIPSVIVPFAADQPFWGKRVADLGVGTSPIYRKDLTVENLAAAIKIATSDEKIKAAASKLGEKIRSEDGVARAVEIINRYLPVH